MILDKMRYCVNASVNGTAAKVNALRAYLSLRLPYGNIGKLVNTLVFCGGSE